MRLDPWEHIVSKFEINYVPNGGAYKYTCFGVSLNGMLNIYGHGYTAEDAFRKMIRNAMRGL